MQKNSAALRIVWAIILTYSYIHIFTYAVFAYAFYFFPTVFPFKSQRVTGELSEIDMGGGGVLRLDTVSITVSCILAVFPVPSQHQYVYQYL